MDLNKQGLDLQQKQLDFNNRMMATQAAIGLTQAAVSVYKAFDDYSKQQEIKTQSIGQKELQLILDQGIKTGDIRVEYDEKGNPIYSGLDDDSDTAKAIKAWRERYSGIIEEKHGGMKWGNAGRAQETFDQMLLEGYYGALREAVEKRHVDTYNLFKSNYLSAIRDSALLNELDGDAKFEKFMEESKGIFTPEERERFIKEGKEQIRLERAKNEGMKIARERGTKAGREYLEGLKYEEGHEKAGQAYFTGDELNDISLDMDKARKLAVKPDQDTLNEEWNERTANPRQPQAELNALERQKGAFEKADNMDAYYTYMQRLLNKGASQSGSGRSETQINDANAALIRSTMDRYEKGEIGIDEAYAEMNRLERTLWTIGEVEKRYKEMLAYKDPQTAQAYEKFEANWTELTRKAKGKELENLNRIKSDTMQTLTRMFTNNNSEKDRKDRMEYIDKVTDETAIRLMQKALDPKATYSVAEQKKLNELSVEGKLDPFLAPVGKEGEQEMKVAGAGESLEKIREYSRGVIEEAIKGTGLTYLEHEYEKKDGNEKDKTGKVFHNVQTIDGNVEKVIVNAKGELEYATGEKKGQSFNDEVMAGKAELERKSREKLSDEDNRQLDALVRRAANAPNPRIKSTAIADVERFLKRKLGSYFETDEGQVFTKYMQEKAGGRL